MSQSPFPVMAETKGFAGYNRYRVVNQPLLKLPRIIRSLLGKSMVQLSPTTWDSLLKLVGKSTSVRQFGVKMHKLGIALSYKDQEDLYYKIMAVRELNGSKRKQPSALARAHKDRVVRMQLMDIAGYLPDDILTKVDRASMAVSLEARVPLLDYRVMELALQLPNSMKLQDGKQKIFLRQLLKKHIPQSLTNTPKSGFSVPIGQWLKHELREWCQDLLQSPSEYTQQFISQQRIDKLWTEHKSGKKNHEKILWHVLMFEGWRRQHDIG